MQYYLADISGLFIHRQGEPHLVRVERVQGPAERDHLGRSGIPVVTVDGEGMCLHPDRLSPLPRRDG